MVCQCCYGIQYEVNEVKNPIGDINKRIDELEKAENEKRVYLQKLEREQKNTEAQIYAVQGAIVELKRLLSPEELFKDAEVVKNADIKRKPSTDKK